MRKRLNHLQMYLAEEFVEEHLAGRMTRRDLVKRVLGITGGIASAATLLATLGCQPAPAAPPSPTPALPSPTTAPATRLPAVAPTVAETATPLSRPALAPTPVLTTTATQTVTAGSRSPLSVPPTDPTIKASDVSFPGDGVAVMGYLAEPAGSGPFPAVLVCHENRGLVEHIRDVTRRFAKAGYVALAVDLLSRDGGTSKVDPAQVPGKLGANAAQAVGDFQSGLRYLQSLATVEDHRIGMTGFCFGGGITWLAATAIPELKAAVPFYGPNPPLQDVPQIQAAVLAIYGELDQRINQGISAIDDAMKRANKTFETIVYPGANHAFHNDTGANWNQQAAVDAWQRTLDWFKRYLV